MFPLLTIYIILIFDTYGLSMAVLTITLEVFPVIKGLDL